MSTKHDSSGTLRVFTLLACTLTFSFSVQGQNFGTSDSLLHAWTNQDIFEGASIGICFQDAGTGEKIAAFQDQLSLAPASTLKLWSTATALEIFSPDYRFTTRLAYSGIIRNDSLIGDLIILGGGDPALGSKYFKDHYFKPHFLQTWIDSLKYHGIRYISGNLLTDASIYDDQTIPDTWTWEDIGNYYGAGPSGLSVYDNLYEIHLYSPAEAGKPTQIIALKPHIPGVEFDNRVLSSDIPRDLAYIYGNPTGTGKILRGTVPKGKTDFVIRGSIPDPPFLVATQFNKMLQDNGISLVGKVQTTDADPDREPVSGTLASTLSPPLIDILRVTNYESVNLFAEHLLKHLAFVKTGLGTREEGIRILYDFWKSKGIDTQSLFICDGSGLSRFNALSCRHMIGMLDYMKNESPYSKAFFSTLPAAPDGTLYYFSAAKFPNKSLQAKSGSMTRIRSFAGILHTTSGREILFHICLNNFPCSQSTAIKAVEDLLARFYLL